MKREELIKQIKERYLTAHCNPDFKGDAFKFIFDDLSSDAKDEVPQPEKEELFEKVYVKTEDDLPKELGYYFVMGLSGDYCLFSPSHYGLTNEWMETVNWWLRHVKKG